jgi:tripeptidyl-peptidase-1
VCGAAVATTTTTVSMRIVLDVPAEQQRALHNSLMAVSTPGHALFGQHLSHEAVHALTRVADDEVARVARWLSKHYGARDVRRPASGVGDSLLATLEQSAARALMRSEPQHAAAEQRPASVVVVVPEGTADDELLVEREQMNATQPQRLSVRLRALADAVPPPSKEGFGLASGSPANQFTAYGIPAEQQCESSKTHQMVW